MTIAAGRLRERVTIQAKNLVDNGLGGRARPPGGPEWIAVSPLIGAEVVALRGDEAVQHAVLRSVQLYQVTIRWRSGVTPAQRLLWGQVPLVIRAAVRSKDRRELVLTCEAGVSA